VYSRVVLIIGLLSLFLLLSYNLIYRTVNDLSLNTLINQNGNNIGSIVEGALYHSMLENNESQLQNILDQINTMPGIEDVNMYDREDNLAYSSFAGDSAGHINPNCKSCHDDLRQLFPFDRKTYRVINGDTECKMSTTAENSRYMIIRSPILNEPSCYQNTACHAHYADEKVLGSLFIKLPLEDLDKAVDRSSREFFFLAAGITIFLATFLIFFTRRRIKDPLNAIVQASEIVSTGNYNTRLEIDPNQLDDVLTLSKAFNQMLDHLQAANVELQNWSRQLEHKVRKKSEELEEVQNELINIEKIASLGKLSSSVAHEINNPLSGILVYTKLVQKKLSGQDMDPQAKESLIRNLKLIEDETKRCGDIVKGLLDFSRQEQDHFENRHIHDIIRETYNLMLHSITIANINFNLDLQAGSDEVFCSSNQIKQAFVALLVNASEAISSNGEITIATRNAENDNIRIDFTDNGSGISTHDLPHIFEPFFTTKHTGTGIGLGLSIVHGIIQSHGGRIDVKTESGKGTTMSILLPLNNKEGG
jgi:two-component system NtrC family sensor kinase